MTDSVSIMPSTVAALNRLAVSRDTQAWAILLEQHGDTILRVANRIVRDPDLAEDIC
ncbi:MAG: hypothetical protein V1899_03265 [Planctomycetota bacterium]